MTRLGLTATAVSLIYFIYTITKKLFFGGVVSGFTGILFTVILFSGVQLITLGIIGEYILRIFFQVTDRPLFVIRDRIVEGKNSNE
jgi:dolichol-phosphate mannosyltransferase